MMYYSFNFDATGIVKSKSGVRFTAKLFESHNFRSLLPNEKLITMLMAIWANDNGNKIPRDSAFLQERLSHHFTTHNFTVLHDAGFIVRYEEPAEKKPVIKAATGYTRDYLAFYGEYPRKDDKMKGFRSYQKAIETTSPTILFAAARTYAKEVEGTEKKYIKLITTWLNGKCWEAYEAVEQKFDAESFIRQQASLYSGEADWPEYKSFIRGSDKVHTFKDWQSLCR